MAKMRKFQGTCQYEPCSGPIDKMVSETAEDPKFCKRQCASLFHGEKKRKPPEVKLKTALEAVAKSYAEANLLDRFIDDAAEVWEQVGNQG